MFSSAVTDHWLPTRAAHVPEEEAFVVVDPGLPENRAVSVVRVEDGPTVVAVSADHAAQIGLDDGETIPADEVTTRIEAAGVSLNDPDHLFYLPLEEQEVVAAETHGIHTRRLTADDAPAFATMVAAAPEHELDEAFVELDHWLVVGTFVDTRLVAAASMYPWGATHLADLGVITLPEFRGRGLARATVRALSAEALARGYEPQYRCQLDNAASVALAIASGFRRFGEWTVLAD
ncbi:GNAT family N-acetyltransferase [Microbacterium sp. NPDC090007]|uniref:GNAT family N-acetyltransferase n=1 Tax=Microbacterium sp. NPDC090007 TaxID=3364204 RepID=UPI003820D180